MRILFLTDNFPPETNAPANRTWEHARYWVSQGHEVTVLTSVPNYPTGNVFPGYRNRLFQSAEMEGIRVVRVWTYMARNAGFFRRTLDQMSYLITSVLASFRLGRSDIVVATSPQFFTAIAGWIVAKVRRRPFVFELRDLWPETIVAVSAMKSSLPLRCLDWLARFLYRQADLIVPVTDTFRDILVEQGIPQERICVVTNGVAPDEVVSRRSRAETLERHGLPDGQFIAGYIGTHGMCQGLATVLEAAELTRDDASLRYVLMGDGAEKPRLLEMARDKQLDNVSFLDSQPRQEAFEMLAAVDASLVVLRDEPLFRTVIPSKIFESMALRRPIVLGVDGESRRIVVEQHQCGLAFQPGDPAALVECVRRLQVDGQLRRRLSDASLAAVQNYRRDRLAQRMLESLQATVADFDGSPAGVRTASLTVDSPNKAKAA